MPDTKRETLTRLYDAAQKTGVAYLLAIVTLGSVTVKELRVLTRDSEPTVNKTLIELETRGLAQRAGGGKADRWFPSALCAQLFHQKLFGEPSSSSSDRIRSSSDPDQIRSSEEEEGQHPKILGANSLAALPAPVRDEEAEREYRIKCYLTDKHYHLTGDKRRAYVEDDTIYAIHFEAWLCQVNDLKRAGVNIKHPAAYALTCCQKGHKAQPECEDRADWELDLKLRYFEMAETDQTGG